MYTDKVPTYTIDLERDEYDRWDEVIRADKKAVMRLAKEADADYECVPGFAKKGLQALVSFGYWLFGGKYRGEMQAWADAMGRSFSEVLLMNLSYELSHAGVGSESIFGCTAGVVKTDQGPMHIRSMDWPLANIGKATRLFKFKEGDRYFYSVGVAGYTGVLSGMLPKAYSVTINWAPPDGRPRFNFGPSFLLREVLETCDTFEEAVEALAETPLSTSVFFTVCGIRNGQACVIERTRKYGAIRPIQGGALVQGNHHVARRFMDNNYDEELLEDSKARAQTLSRCLLVANTDSLEEVAECLDEEPVYNAESYQQMAFCPRTGEIKVWRWV